MLTLHAEGAQVYECKAGTDGKLGLGVPRADRDTAGSTARPSAVTMPGRTGNTAMAAPWSARLPATPRARRANDIPWLKLTVTSRRGTGILTGVTTVQRINTAGGKLEGACDKAGTFTERALLRGLRVPAQELSRTGSGVARCCSW